MDSAPTEKTRPVSVPIAIVLAPLALAFIIAACLAGGPSEVFKALTGRK